MQIPKKKVLLVDDVKLFIELEKTFFQRKDTIEVLTAASGRQALEIVEAERPDLVYMDLYMPEMNGDACCRIIKESGSDIPVVMVTSAGSKEDRERCLAAGCDEIITKPINRANFLSVAKKYLDVHERKEPRYAVHIKVSYGGSDSLLSDYTVNLNTGGLFIAADDLLPVDSELKVEFSLPSDSLSVACRARVAWINSAANPSKKDLPVGMGLQFLDIGATEMNIIEEYISSNALAPVW